MPKKTIPRILYGIVYCLKNNINGKEYIGQTTRILARRFRGHCEKGTPACRAIHAAIQKYGKENFEASLLSKAYSKKELDKLEIKEIARRGTIAPGGYNLKTGGANGKCSEETKALHRAVALLRNNLSGLRNPDGSPKYTGAMMSAEARERMGETQRRRLVNGHSEETKAKMSAAALRRGGVSEETKRKLSISNLGKPHHYKNGNPRVKNWIVIHPNGKRKFISNLRQYVLNVLGWTQNDYVVMSEVGRGLHPSHRDFRVKQRGI